MAWQKELETARAAAIKAGELALRYREGAITAEAKLDDSPVTIADRESERLLSALLSDVYPEDGLLGEEGAHKESRNGRRWIIDPIDGTRDYVRGNPMWAVLIGLEVDDEVAVGVCHFPALEETYVATRGGGAWRNGKRLSVSSIDSVGQAVLCFNGLNSIHKTPFADRLVGWMRHFWAVRSLGGAPDAMLVASGRADAWIEPTAKPWDLAPLKILTEEAGGKFFNFDGGTSIHGGNCITCVPALESELRDFLQIR